MTEDEVTVASHSSIDEAHLSIDICVDEGWLVDERLQFFLFLLAQNFDQSLVLENNLKWNLVVSLSLC